MAEVMGAQDLAAYLDMSQSTIYRLARRGRLPGAKLGRRWRFHKEAIDRWLSGNVSETPAAALSERESAAWERGLAMVGESLSRAIAMLAEATGMDSGTVFLWNKNGLRIAASQGVDERFLKEEDGSLARGECLCGQAAAGEAVLSRDVLADARVTRPACRAHGMRGVLSLPLTSRGNVLGVVNLGSRRPLEDDSLLKTVQPWIGLLALLAESLLLQEEARALADADPLTGLGNRRRFWREMEREMAWSQRYLRPLSLIVLDVDDLKQVNDHFGHQAGDLMLKGVAEILGRSVRASDLAGRYGGDEFVLLLPEAKCSDALVVARRIQEQIAARPFQIERNTIHASLSMGIACYPDYAASAEDLFARADAALLQAKQTTAKIVVFGDESPKV